MAIEYDPVSKYTPQQIKRWITDAEYPYEDDTDLKLGRAAFEYIENLEQVANKLRETRGQWIHSVHAHDCVFLLKSIGIDDPPPPTKIPGPGTSFIGGKP